MFFYQLYFTFYPLSGTICSLYAPLKCDLKMSILVILLFSNPLSPRPLFREKRGLHRSWRLGFLAKGTLHLLLRTGTPGMSQGY